MSLLDCPAAPLGRRLAAAVYDLLIVLALIMVAAFIAHIPRGGVAIPPNTFWFQFYLLMWLLAYFGYCWNVGGHTVGMRAWKLQLVDAQGARVSWTRSAVRMSLAFVATLAAGLQFWWCLFDREQQSLADRVADTRMVWTR
jgi:uncharacterized RDD family membrane protein YckC